MVRWNSLPTFVRHILLGIGLFVGGAAFSFGYSYRPLHGALAWKVDQLQTRLDQRNLDDLVLRDELTKVSRQQATRVDPETLAQVERELDRTQRALGEAEKKIRRADRRRREANANADRWRERYETLRGARSKTLPAAAAISAAPEETALAATPLIEQDPGVEPVAPLVPAEIRSSEQSTRTPEEGMLLPDFPSSAPDLP
ncbi:MAG: hypothetical protein V3T64_16300 [Myxococcota bacterium]